MIILFFILCIVLGLAIAPVLLVIVRKSNTKLLLELQGLFNEMEDLHDSKGSRESKRIVFQKAISINEKIGKTLDIQSKRTAKEILATIRSAYYATN